MTARGITAAVALLLATAAGCSDDGPSDLSPEDAAAAVQDVVLTADDVGPGWQSTPPQPKQVGNLDLNACTGAVDVESDAIAEPARFGFAAGAGPESLALVAGATTALPREDVDALFERVAAPAFASCLADAAAASGTTGGTFDADGVTTRRVDVGTADHGVEVRLPFTADLRQSTSSVEGGESSTTALRGVVTIELIGHGQLVTILGVFSIEGSVSPDDAPRWAALLAARQQRAQQ